MSGNSHLSAKIWWAAATDQERKHRIGLMKAASRRKYCLPVGACFGRWTVEQYHGPDGYTCRCSCGTIRIVRRQTLVLGESQSCGCLASELNQAKGRNAAFTTALRALFQTTRFRAKYQKHRWRLSFKLYKTLIFQPCCYCGVVGTNFKKTQRKDLIGSFYYNGLDRVDATEGYTPGNVVPCCKVCNRAKSDMVITDFKAWLDQLIIYSRKEKS